MVHPFDLLEISSQTACYLDSKALLRCALVSKAWHRAFLPALWNDVQFDHMDQQILDSLERHSHLVQALSWQSSGSLLDLRTLSLDFPRLRSVNTNVDSKWNGDLLDAVERLIQRQGHVLHTVSLSSERTGLGMIPDRSLWSVTIAGCKGYRQLRSLSLHRICFLAQDLDGASKDLLKQLDSFSLILTVLYRADSSDPVLPEWGLTESKIRHLTLTNCEHNFPSDHLETEYRLLLDCQEIRSLKWERYLRDNMVPMATDLQRGCWPFLEKLDFQGFEIGDEALAEILWSLGRPLRSLNANHTGFGLLSYRALLNLFENEGGGVARGQKHAQALERLILQACSSVTGTQIQSFLCSLPKLKVFSAILLKEDDVLADPRPWVCKQIRKLELNFALLELDAATVEGDQPEAISMGAMSRQKSTCFWERLQDLTSLEEFSTGNSRNIILDRNELVVGDNNLRYPLLLFQLEDPISANGNCSRGLEALKTWRKTRRLALWDSVQEMSLSDARWMVDHWLLLEEVITYKWRKTQTGIKELFEAHGVRF